MAWTVPPRSGGGESTEQTTGPHSVDLPADFEVGGMLIVAVVMDSLSTGSTVIGGWPAWLTQLFRKGIGVGEGHIVGEVRYCIFDGTEAGWPNIDFDLTTDVAEAGAWQWYYIPPGEHNGTPPEIAFLDEGNVLTPDPPSLEPSWGSKENLWITGCMHDHSGDSITAVPTNYTSIRAEDKTTATDGAGVQGAYRVLDAASDDPGTWTLDSSEQSISFTIAVEPADAGGGADTVLPTFIASSAQMFAPAVTAGEGDPVFELTGTVTLGGSPVEGATVRLIDQTADTLVGETLTDASGNYVFSDLDESHLYHATAEWDDAGTLHHAPSQPYLVPTVA